MISLTRAPLSPELAASVRANDERLVAHWRHWLCAPIPLYKPSEWLEQHIILDIKAAKKKKWSFTGREYIREQIDQIENPDCSKLTSCGGTGSGKTLRDYGIMLYEFVHNPFPGLYIMPAKSGPGGGTAICDELTDTMDATPFFADRLPRGAARKTNLTKTRIEFGGNDLDFVGANSANQVGNKRCRRVFLGEQDKIKDHLGKEAAPDYLAGERTKGMPGSLIIRGSTPSIEGRGIWLALLGNGDSSGSDCRRRFLPCPHCNPQAHRTSDLKGRFVLIKDAQYNTALPTKLPDGTPIPFAEMRWDPEAKRRDGTWDTDRVVASVRFECPHCGGHIRDTHRDWMDENGIWIPTRRGERGHVGYQLSSYYAPIVTDDFGQTDFESTYGGMALKFLGAIEKGTIGGYINSDLAEVNASQQHAREEIITISDTATESVKSVYWWPELSVDRQAKYPGFWYRVRRWIASILRPTRTAEQQAEFHKSLAPAEQAICATIAPPIKDDGLYAAATILAQIQRTDHWPRIADWLIANSITGHRLTEFFQVEFQTNLIRLLEFIARQPSVNIPLGRQGDSECVEFGSADSWEEIDDAQRRWQVAHPDVLVDARFGSMDNAEVFAECFRRCPPTGFCYFSPVVTPFGPRGRFSQTPMPGYKPFAQWGWTPALGYPEHKVWPGKDKIRLPYIQEVNDPFIGKMEARQFYQYVFKFDAQWALSELARIRKRYTWSMAKDFKIAGQNAEMRPVTVADYNLHLKGYYWDEKEARWAAPGKQGGAQSRRHPNHLYDCEKNGLAHAVWKGIFKYERDPAVRP